VGLRGRFSTKAIFERLFTPDTRGDLKHFKFVPRPDPASWNLRNDNRITQPFPFVSLFSLLISGRSLCIRC
jgi:hypothetical protein